MGKLEDRENKRKSSVINSMINETNINESDQQTQKGFVIEPKDKEETRSKRVNLLVQPSVYKKAEKKCEKLGISVNECLNQFLSNWVKE